MNDFPAKRNLFVKRRDLCRFARLPSTLGNHASTMGADVFGVSQLRRIDRMILDVGKMHNNSDRETLFHPSVESVGDGHIALIDGKSLRLGAGGPLAAAVQLGPIVGSGVS
jgi:hypothetical protein